MSPSLILTASAQAYNAKCEATAPFTSICIMDNRIIVFSPWGAMSVQAYKALTQ